MYPRNSISLLNTNRVELHSLSVGCLQNIWCLSDCTDHPQPFSFPSSFASLSKEISRNSASLFLTGSDYKFEFVAVWIYHHLFKVAWDIWQSVMYLCSGGENCMKGASVPATSCNSQGYMQWSCLTHFGGWHIWKREGELINLYYLKVTLWRLKTKPDQNQKTPNLSKNVKHRSSKTKHVHRYAHKMFLQQRVKAEFNIENFFFFFFLNWNLQ